MWWLADLDALDWILWSAVVVIGITVGALASRRRR